MKKQLSLFIFLLTFSSLLFYSCSNKDTTPAPKTKTQLLTQSTWKFKGATVGGADFSGSLQACQKDNLLTFVSTGTGTLDEGTAKCTVTDPQTNPFTWNFATNETILHISTILFTGGNSDFTIVSLTETSLVVYQNISFGPGPVFNAVISFMH
ncbi:MAG: lipocalin family protein [Chitinophagaceae bacterium]|nr:lipocalin family protein [Chitinophagaceae bacterium]